MDSRQLISILAACAPHSTPVKFEEGSEEALKLISYESVASILRQCEKKYESIPGMAGFPGAPSGRLTPAQLQAKKNVTRCNHSRVVVTSVTGDAIAIADGSLKPGVKSFDKPQVDKSQIDASNGNQSAILDFHMAQLGCDGQLSSPIGPLLDDGAPYSGIGVSELQDHPEILSAQTGMDSLMSFQKLIRHRPFWQYGSGSHSSKIAKDLRFCPVDCNI